MSHRVKNLFALSSAIVSLSGKAGGSAQDLIKVVQGRLGALSRAHELTLAGLKADHRPAPTTLLALIQTLVSPFECSPGERVSVTGPEIPVSGTAITPLALVFHELATNAAKYGALSNTEGSIGIELEVSGPELRLAWSERGGPPPDPSLRTDGFGTRLIDGTVTGQLRGTVAREWPRDGLVVVMTMPLASLDGSGSAA